ncbi:CCHC-type domain-containing protein [Camponotus japonicus]
MGSSSSQEALNNEQADSANANEEIFPKDTPASTAAIVPSKFISKDDFFTTWLSWKDEFLTYMKDIDKEEANRNMWGIMLLNRMGPVGQEIYRTFSFYDKNAEEDINVLIKKFDIYCMYRDKKKVNEDIDKYVNDLKLTAIAHNYADPTSIVREKIIEDISTQCFTGKAALFIERKGTNFIPFLQSLDLNNIILFWKQCEDLMTQKYNNEYNEEMPKQNSAHVTSTIIDCNRCGKKHSRNRCPAWGVQCSKCKQFNHLTECCKVKYVDNCTKCGTSHIQSRCPAFGEVCTKCGKSNHLSWKCQIPFINNCWRCGQDHVASACPAQGQICRRCNKPNHLEEQCASKLDDSTQQQ